MAKKKTDEVQETPEAAVEETVVEETAAEVEAAADETTPAEIKAEEAAPAKEVSDEGEAKPFNKGKRMEKIGVVSSDKMTNTVVVRVDRVVKHPVYRKYVRKRKKFMAHDETGARIGDKVRIVETRPLSARKRWRVVEIIQKAEL